MKMLARLGISVLLVELLLTPLAGCSTRQLAVTKISIQESPFSDMTNKKVILRNDDVGDPVNATLKWLSDLVIEKDIKMTYAVMPKILQDNPETLAYLKNLDSSRFEMGVHGYAHEQFETLSYDNQYPLIKQATDLMKQFFSTDPRTFLPPFQSANVETTKVLKDLGYHTMASIRHYSDPYVETDFAMNDFGWELTWSPVTFATFQDFVQAFDDFYERGQSQSGNDFFVIQSHHGAWVDDSGQLNSKIVNDYEKSIEYMKSKKVEFMTVEEGYEWVIDEPLIVVGVTDSNSYLIDLRNCNYNHPVRFNSPPGWGGRILIRDISTSGGISISKEGHMPGPSLEFNGERGHQYLIVNMVGSDQGDINLRPVLETIGNKLVNTGELLSFIISATDPNDDMLRYTASNSPPGASFDTQTHKFSWMATSRGPYSNVHFEVSDGQLTVSEDINIRINLPPIITPIGIKEITTQHLLQFNISAYDPDGDTLTYSASNLPSGAIFNPSTGTFTWVPSAVGTYSNVHFEVSDGHMASSEDITIKVYYAGYEPPSVSFIAPTDADGATISRNSTEINVSVAGSDDSSGFIDWNRSLVGYWSFGEGSGTTANDKSSYGSNGTLKNGPQWTTGKLGNALQFTGNGAYLEVPHNDSFNFGTGDFTIEFWIKNSQPLLNESNVYGIANKASEGSNGVGWSCALRGGAYNGIYFRTQYPPSYSVTEVIPAANYSSVVSDGNWHHFVVTRSSGTVTLYLDGNQIGSKVADQDVTSSAPLYIGTFGGTSAYALNASLDEFRIWNRALSQPEIKASYNAKVNSLITTFVGLPNGSYQYYASVMDLVGNFARTETRSIVVSTLGPTAPIVTTSALPTGIVGTAYSQTLAATGGTTPYTWTIASGTLPAGLSLSSSGVISGTPTTAGGPTSVTFKVTDSASAMATKTLAITINSTPLSITTSSLPNGTVGVAYSQTLATSGGTTPYTWTISSGTLPAGLVLSSGGVISGTPTTAGGPSSVTFRVTESASTTATKTLTITVGYAAWDVNRDGTVNVLDMISISQHWGESGTPGWMPQDVNGDGVINALDMIIIGQHWTG